MNTCMALADYHELMEDVPHPVNSRIDEVILKGGVDMEDRHSY